MGNMVLAGLGDSQSSFPTFVINHSAVLKGVDGKEEVLPKQ